MTTKKTVIFSLVILLFISCRQRPYKDISTHSDWTSINLPNGWTLQVPKSFKDSSAVGVDSDPGYIYSTADSISLEYDSSRELLHKPDCDFEKEIAEAKRPYLLSIYKQRTGIDHVQNVDTIGDRAVSIITSTQIGKGITQLSIHDCSTGAWLGITGDNLSVDKRTLVLEIFKTVKLQTDKK